MNESINQSTSQHHPIDPTYLSDNMISTTSKHPCVPPNNQTRGTEAISTQAAGSTSHTPTTCLSLLRSAAVPPEAATGAPSCSFHFRITTIAASKAHPAARSNGDARNDPSAEVPEVDNEVVNGAESDGAKSNRETRGANDAAVVWSHQVRRVHLVEVSQGLLGLVP
jgi:hypothetical protein